jgi:hypothetical protein
MRAISKWAKDKGTEVGKAIRAGETKQAIKLLVDAQNLKNGMRRATENSDRLVYDKNEIAIYWYETATETLYALEQ